MDPLRLHASYGTSFCAPDMNYIFQSKSLGYFASTTDYYRCAIANLPLATCPYTNYSPGANYTQLGSENLDFENGRSFDYGIVFTPPHQTGATVDRLLEPQDQRRGLADRSGSAAADRVCVSVGAAQTICSTPSSTATATAGRFMPSAISPRTGGRDGWNSTITSERLGISLWESAYPSPRSMADRRLRIRDIAFDAKNTEMLYVTNTHR